MKSYSIEKEFAVFGRADSSYGNQPKFKKDGYWYKYNNVGNEGLTEQLVSDVLSCSSITNYVTYEYCKINGLNGCRSADMLKLGENIIPFSLLYKNITGRILADDVWAQDETDRFDFITDFIKNETGVDCSRYLFDTLTLDMLTRNPDRHFKNLALIQSADGSLRPAPIFDNGQGLMQNFTITPPYMSTEEKEHRCVSCTISGNFEKQFILAQNATGYKPFTIDYNKLYDVLQKYPREGIATDYLSYSLNRYADIFQGDDREDRELTKADRNEHEEELDENWIDEEEDFYR